MITHAPGWPTIPEQIKLGGRDAGDRARARRRRLHAARPTLFIDAITPRTKGIVINSPANPTGALISEDELTKLAKFAAGKGIWIVLDLCYEKLIYEPVPHNLPGVLQRELRDRSVVCGSASKAYAMTGWRCGWAIGPKEVIAACGALQSHQTSNVCSITQRAVVAALTRPAGVRHRHARGIPRRAATSVLGVADGRSAHQVRQAGRRVLSVHRHLGAARRRTACARRRSSPIA